MDTISQESVLESIEIQTVPFSPTLDVEVLEKWSRIAIQSPSLENPEWQPTPMTRVDLQQYGYGTVYIKREDTNPSGTAKARAALEHAKQYSIYAQLLLKQLEQKSISRMQIEDMRAPILSMITSGSEGRAMAHIFAQYDLPPPHVLIDTSVSDAYLHNVRARIFKTDFRKKQLTREDILRLTQNNSGTDINGNIYLEPQKVYYNWLVHEVFNAQPQFIFMPFGSGRLLENFLYWQKRTAQNFIERTPDFRLQAKTENVMHIHIVGGEPRKEDSKATKLTAPFKPFRFFSDHDINQHAASPWSGKYTAKELVREEYIEFAYSICCNQGIPSEPSSSVGLALYLQQYDRYRTCQKNPLTTGKVVIINTGCGPQEYIQYLQKYSEGKCNSTLALDGQP